MDAVLEKRGSRVRLAGWGIAVAIILTPLVAMQFTPQVQWTPLDFVFAIVVIGGTGLMFEMAVGLSGNLAYRGAAALALLASLTLVWVEGAVGIVGDSGDPLNLMFAGGLLVEIAGSLAARFKPQGMAYAMGATAFAQLAAAAVAGIDGWMTEALLCLPWVVLWGISAGLFRLAARQGSGT